MDISLIKLIIHWHLIPVWTGLLHSGCVRDPYVLLKGTISTNESVQKLSCQDFKLYTCLNSSLYNFNHSFVTLRRLQIWLPVNQTRPWEGSPETHALWKIIKEVLQHSKSFTGLLMAALAGIIAIATSAAAARVAPHHTVPTATFVQEQHQNASSAWGSQTHTDQGMNDQSIDLENSVLLLGDKVQNLKLQVHLKCDWNISSFCVTPHKYNQSAYTWDQLSKHLRGHIRNNLSLNISQLQATISNMQNVHLKLLPETDLNKSRKAYINLTPWCGLKL